MVNLWSVLAQTLALSVTAAVLLAAKRLFLDKLSPRWQYGVWAILALRALLPAGLLGRTLVPGGRVVLEAARLQVELPLSSALTDPMAHFCAVLDSPDEDLDPFQTEALGRDLQAQASALQALLATGRRGQMLAQGITCALIGRPNAGKSSLLNALAGYERAIVTHLPGTTRDTIEVKVELAGRPFRLVDTAGLRDSDDPIEQLGVDRSRQAMAQADLLLMVCDGTQPLDPQDQALLNQALAQADTILAVNKGDLPGYRLPAPEGAETGHTLTVVELSAKTGLGLAALEQAMGRLADRLLPQVQEEAAGQLLTNGRQTDAVRRALEAVERAQAALEAGVTPDALLTDVEEAMAALGELTGKTLREDITQRIFDRFCVGK